MRILYLRCISNQHDYKFEGEIGALILAFDTYYVQNKAKTVGVSFDNWSDAEPVACYEETLEGAAAYEPGAFYKRELPCILSLLEKIPLATINTIIIDGYVVLNDSDKMGLGGYLYKELGGTIPVIGVAKSKFRGNSNKHKELFRGKSTNPLYITAMGIALDTACAWVNAMHGDFRMPTLLKLLDTKTRT